MHIGIITFLIQGSALAPYEVIFNSTEASLQISCNCSAGLFKKLCKHKINLLNGSSLNLISENKEQIPLIQNLVKNTYIPEILNEITIVENDIKKMQLVLKKIKAKLDINLSETPYHGRN